MIVQRKKHAGFTLIEVMVVVVIVGILASIAYPSYRESVAKSRRAAAKTTLIASQQWMERFYTENFRYDKNSAGVAVTDASQFPSRFSVSPPPGEGGAVYDISVVVTDGVRDSYKVKATRKVGTQMAIDRCGDFLLDQYGRKDLENYASSFSSKAQAIQTCW